MASSEEKDLQKKVQQSAAGADVHEGGAKAEKFQKFLKENDINFFESQTLADEFHTTIFRSRIEAKGQIMPMAIFIDDSIKDHLNALNAEYKIFKYYLREDGNIYLDICVPFVDETFDSRMIQTLLPILVQQLETVYEDLMAVVWAKE